MRIGTFPRGKSVFSSLRFSLALLLFIIAIYPTSAQSATLVSATAGGTSGTGDSGSPDSTNASMSGDGSKIVFQSRAEDFAGGDIDGVQDIFLWTAPASITLITPEEITTGTTGNSENPVISRDGSTIAFQSGSTNLVSSPTVSSIQIQIYIYDGALKLVSHNFDEDDGGDPGSSTNPSINSDGSKVVFQTAATDLLDDMAWTDANGGEDIFIADVTQDPPELTLVSKADGVQETGNGSSSQAKISANGSCVVFVSSANNLDPAVSESGDAPGTFDDDVFLWEGGNITMISRVGSNGGDGASTNPVVSDDCTTVAFQSSATNLVGGVTDANGTALDVFVWRGDVLSVASLAITGTETGDSQSLNPSLSGDGNRIVFQSEANNLVDSLLAPDTNGVFDIFVGDLNAFPLVAVNLVSWNGDNVAAADGTSQNPKISQDGNNVAFISNASDLVEGLIDGNGTNDIVLRDLAAQTNQQLNSVLSLNNGAEPASDTGDGQSLNPQISDTGRYVVFESDATDLAPVDADQNGARDLFRGESAGIVVFSDDEYTVDEDDGTVTITAKRTNGNGGSISVNYTTEDDSATQPSDYETASGVLTWADGDGADKTFTVTIANDALAEPEESLKLKLSLDDPPVGGARLGDPNEAILKIINEDEDCDNGSNDEGNGEDSDADCDDDECTTDPSCIEICDNGMDDNDSDTDSDCDDSECDSAPNCNLPEVCNNGLDDDDDTFTDCADSPECDLHPFCDDPTGDGDGDGVGNDVDNCPDDGNPGQEDSDNDDIGDVCDTVEGDCDNNENDDDDVAGGGDALVDCDDSDCAAQSACNLDTDGDGVVDGADNCPAVDNADQEDSDNDDIGNLCDTQENACTNGENDDEAVAGGDALIDCEDPDCSAHPTCLEDCDNGVDDLDIDGDVDCADSECSADPVCQEDCDNGIEDIDLDSDLDCADSECISDPACQEDCDNGMDDADTDLDSDCDDSECAAAPNCQPAIPEDCDNGTDDDGDLSADCLDPDCAGAPNCLGGGAENCGNGGDDDGDGDADCNDSDCAGAPNCQTPLESCTNGSDDDGDGDADCDDSDCASSPACTNPTGDLDGDGDVNSADNCPGDFNPAQQDADQDGLGDACDPTPSGPGGSGACGPGTGFKCPPPPETGGCALAAGQAPASSFAYAFMGAIFAAFQGLARRRK